MTYVTLSADYLDYCLQDSLGGAIDRDRIPRELQEQLVAWNSDYQGIIPMSRETRAAPEMSLVISDLDRRGLALASLIESVLADASKVGYYSEGLLRRLW